MAKRKRTDLEEITASTDPSRRHMNAGGQEVLGFTVPPSMESFSESRGRHGSRTTGRNDPRP